MRERELLKQLLPPILLSVVRRARNSRAEPHIWNGVYRHFRDVPASGSGHAQERQIEFTRRSTRRAHDWLTDRKSSDARVPAEHALTPLIAALERPHGRWFSILDIGGGLGIGYFYLRASMGRSEKVRYDVVEVNQLAEAGREMFPGHGELAFHAVLPGDEEIGRFDLVQFCGSLQYIEDYEAAIARACRYRPRFLYLLKIPAGNFQTFVTAQHNLHASVIPVWFFNLDELVSLCASHGYHLIYQGTHDRVYDTTNFAPAFRMSRYSHLLFVPVDKPGVLPARAE